MILWALHLIMRYCFRVSYSEAVLTVAQCNRLRKGFWSFFKILILIGEWANWVILPTIAIQIIDGMLTFKSLLESVTRLVTSVIFGFFKLKVHLDSSWKKTAKSFVKMDGSRTRHGLVGEIQCPVSFLFFA